MRVESRKVQKVGSSTLSVSLPKAWVTRTGIQKGDIVLFEDMRDGALRVAPGATGGPRERDHPVVVDADLATDKGMLERIVVGNYVIGRNHVVIKSKTRIRSDQIREVRDAVNKLMGLGIMLETSDTIELQCSIDASRFPMESVIKRLYTIGATMQKEAMEAFARRDKQLAQDAREREDEADMVYWLALRLLLTSQVDPQVAEQIGIHQQLPIVGNRLICKNLEHVADYADNVARSVLDVLAYDVRIDPALVRKFARMSELAGRIVADGLSCIFSHDLKLANHAIETGAQVERIEREILDEVLRRHDDPALVASLRSVTWSLRRIAEYGGEIAVIGVNRYLERDSNLCHKADDSFKRLA